MSGTAPGLPWQMKNWPACDLPQQIPLLDRSPKKNPTSVRRKVEEAEKKKKKKEKQKKAPKEPYLFPHWCVYVAWCIVFSSIIASSVMLIIYGMVFGNSKSWQWLTSVLMSFFQDVIILQPIKVTVHCDFCMHETILQEVARILIHKHVKLLHII